MSRDSIGSFMSKLRKTLDLKFETLKSFDYENAGTNTETVKVDETFSKLNVIVSGKNSKLSVRDRNNVEVVTSDDFSLDNVKFMTFDVTDSSYTIEASAESAYSVKIGGISELKFDFGFSTDSPTDQAETAVQPLKGSKNIISVFLSNPSLVKCLTHVTIIPASSDDSFSDLIVHFDNKLKNFYSSKPFDLPSNMFKIKVFGYDRKGNLIERQISTGIESVTGSEFAKFEHKLTVFFETFIISVPPEIEIEYSGLQVDQYSNLHLNCKVLSLTPTKTTWILNSEVLKTISSK
jgi:hypothetical protein